MGKPGYAYACCRQTERNSIKIGFTESECPDEYLHSTFSRTLHPLEILKIMPCGNARLAESVIHYALNAYRIDPSHELFDMTDCGVEQLDRAFDTFRLIDDLSGSEKAAANPPNRLAYRSKIQQAQTGISKDEASVARAMRKEQREKEISEKRLKQQKRHEEQQKRNNALIDLQSRFKREILDYISEMYNEQHDARVSSTFFYDNFATWTKSAETPDRLQIAEIMKDFGFIKKPAKLYTGQRKTVNCFFGLRSKESLKN